MYKMHEKFMVKVQIPIATNLTNPLTLVYDRNKEIVLQIPMRDIPKVIEAMRDEEGKLSQKEYFMAELIPGPVVGSAVLNILTEEKQDQQDW